MSDISVTKPPVIPVHNGITCVNMIIFLAEWVHVKDIVDVKQLLDKNLTSIIL